MSRFFIIMLNVIMLNVIMLSDIMLSVVAPHNMVLLDQSESVLAWLGEENSQINIVLIIIPTE